MEKFGIFELLDALSALTAQKEEQASPPAEQTAERKRPDETFVPPSYGEAQSAPPAAHDADALAGFLARHDAVARKAKK